MRKLVAATGVLFALSGCAAEQACTLIGTPVGISVRVDAPLADRVSAAELTACWNGSCRTAEVELHPAGGVARQTCEGEACTAEIEPTGGKQGFGDVAGLPKAPVRVALRLKGQGGEAVVERELTVTPVGSFPNGPNCGEGGPQAAIAVSGSGVVSEVG
ncbi:hypothetical protein AB0B45_33555 [Nonomuraea sp. NPDC049152]|uniref:hypothetical protein n=1 Tax=Nonomuraea sp. NPDC049152 TaxID=3154350 RepID=UPI0033FD9456